MFKNLIYVILAFIVTISSSYAGFITKGFQNLGVDLSGILANANVLAVFYFIALLFGMFSLFNVLLKFAFKDHALHGENKARKVVAFMIAFIGTSGIFFMFTGEHAKPAKEFVLLMGGFFGFLIVLVLSFFVFKLFQSLADGIYEKDKKAGMAGYVLMMILAVLTISYLNFGYAGQVLEQYQCTPTSEEVATHQEDGFFKEKLCEQSTFFGTLMYWTIVLIELAVFSAFIAAIVFAVKKIGGNNESSDESSEENKKSKEKQSRIKKVEGALNTLIKDAKKLGDLSKDEDDLLKQMSTYLEGVDKTSKRVPGQQAGGGK